MTSEYVKTSDVVVPFGKCKKEEVINVYLAVFNELAWQPVAWRFLKNSKEAEFKNLGRGVVYLPIYYKNSEEQVANYPFLLDNRGNIKELAGSGSPNISSYVNSCQRL